MKKGRLYVIESGSDASGKATQSNLLYEYFLKKKEDVLKFEFPNYKSLSSTMVKMYLNGDFGKNPNDVNPYITSTFFAIDRYVTFKKEIEYYYNMGYTIIADRYTTSNMVYQSGKYESLEEKEKFLNWLFDYEFNLYKLPKPDRVFFLDLDFKISYDLMIEREKKQNRVKDIHENDEAYLKKVYENAKYVAKKYDWTIIKCDDMRKIKSIDDIHKDIISRL